MSYSTSLGQPITEEEIRLFRESYKVSEEQELEWAQTDWLEWAQTDWLEKPLTVDRALAQIFKPLSKAEIALAAKKNAIEKLYVDNIRAENEKNPEYNKRMDKLVASTRALCAEIVAKSIAKK